MPGEESNASTAEQNIKIPRDKISNEPKHPIVLVNEKPIKSGVENLSENDEFRTATESIESGGGATVTSGIGKSGGIIHTSLRYQNYSRDNYINSLITNNISQKTNALSKAMKRSPL